MANAIAVTRKTNPAPISEQLRVRLSALSYLAFAIAVSMLLKRLGYTDIPYPSRRFYRGPNALGGVDLVARQHTHLTVLPVLIQLKQVHHQRPVSRHFIDALRGALLREGVPLGISISTVGFSAEAIAAANRFPGRPIRLIPGHELGQLAADLRLGVVEVEHPITGERSLILDEVWFLQLEAYCERLREQKESRGGCQ